MYVLSVLLLLLNIIDSMRKVLVLQRMLKKQTFF